MTRVSPGWLLTAGATALLISCWLPWLTTAEGGGGRASAIGGTFGSLELPSRFGAGQLIVLLSSVLAVLGAMVARGLSDRLAAGAAVVVALLVGVLTWSYHQANVRPPVVAGYGFYIGATAVAAVLACSVWSLLATFADEPPVG